MPVYLVGFGDGHCSHSTFTKVVEIEESKIDGYVEKLFKKELMIYFEEELKEKKPAVTREEVSQLLKEQIAKTENGYNFPKKRDLYWEYDAKMNCPFPDVDIECVKLTEQQIKNLPRVNDDNSFRIFYNEDENVWREAELRDILAMI